MNMRPSRVLRKLRSGSIASCVKLNLSEPRVVEIAAMCGFDCVWVDLEHVANTLADVENQVRAAKAYDVDVVVRVPRGSYSDLIRPLEMDAAGIMVPHVMNGEEARRLARQTKFHPVGRRALDGGNADGGYCLIPLADYLDQANRERFVIVQIEDPEALEEIDAIAATPGIDMVMLGPGDLSHALGVAGHLDDPRVVEAQKRVAAAAHRHGKFAATVGSPDNAKELAEMGYHLINLGADVHALTGYFRKLLSGFNGTSLPPAGGGVYGGSVSGPE